MRFSSLHELFLAYGHGYTQTHRAVTVRMEPGRRIKTGSEDSRAGGRRGRQGARSRRTPTRSGYLTTTIGRAIFNDILPPGMPFYNYELDKRGVQVA